jgi:hypothetical protein
VVHFVRKVVGAPVVSKEILSERTGNYQNWVEAYARNQSWRRKSEQGDKWSFCLTAGTLCPANRERQ